MTFAVTSCVITSRFGTAGIDRFAFRLHPYVAVASQHAAAHVASDRHDGLVGSAVLGKLGDGAVLEIVETEASSPAFLVSVRQDDRQLFTCLVGSNKLTLYPITFFPLNLNFGTKAAKT